MNINPTELEALFADFAKARDAAHAAEPMTAMNELERGRAIRAAIHAAEVARYGARFDDLVAQIRAQREARELGVSAAEKAELLREKYASTAEGMFDEDRRERIAARESRLLGSY